MAEFAALPPDTWEARAGNAALRVLLSLGVLPERGSRLSRSLTPDERAQLVDRLDRLGPDRLGDVVLDLDPRALAVWLTDPQAR